MAAPHSPPNADELRDFAFDSVAEAEVEAGRGVAKMWDLARNATTP